MLVSCFKRLYAAYSPSTAMSWVAQRNTSANHQKVKFQMPLLPFSPAASINLLTTEPSQSMEKPEMVWMGRIQLFRRPRVGDHTASTIGLQNSFSEYGYAAREKTPMAEYEATLFNKNGTDPMARPMGMPCKKYSNTSSKKFLWSFLDSSMKPAAELSSFSSSGISSSRLKLDRPISEATWLVGEVLSIEPCLRLCSIMLFMALRDFLAFPLFVASMTGGSGDVGYSTDLRFSFLLARLLICDLVSASA